MLTEKDGFLVFTKDAEFSGPSAAAAVIHGSGANGLMAWKTEDGKSLKQLEEQARFSLKRTCNYVSSSESVLLAFSPCHFARVA